MLNFSSLRSAPSLPSRPTNFFVPCLVFLFAVFGGLMWYIHFTGQSLSAWTLPLTPREKSPVDTFASPAEQIRSLSKESRSFLGTIEQVVTLKTTGTRILSVRSSVLDEEKLDQVNFDSDSVNLPQKEHVFRVAVSSDATLRGKGATLEALRSGDMVSVTTKETLSDAEELTAESVEKIMEGPLLEVSPNNTQPEGSE
ncbi:MAG: hypothetical protein IPL87_01000 [Candidatus Moraniibacteriota bacterium]|nr:MAG: hypothetical protein IPL87_01000 [Candidatus Moranbacteria bacterium]